MSRLLFTLWDGGGNVPPVVSVASALGSRGHDVTVLADQSLEPAVSGAGLHHLPWQEAPQRASSDPASEFVRDFEPKTPFGALARVRDRLIVEPAEAFCTDTLSAIEEVEAEAVISENLLLGCQIAATESGLPSVSLVPNAYPGNVPGVPPFGMGLAVRDDLAGRVRDRVAGALGRRLWDRRLEDVNRLMDRYGQPPLPTLFAMLERPDRVLVLTSAAFEPGQGQQVPERVRYCGPRLEDPDWTADWAEPDGEGPLVLVSLSTTTQNQKRMIERIVRALGTLPVRGLVTTGPSFTAEGLEVPGNVTLVESAPHSLVLRHADAVVSHGGHGTVIKSLANGVPVLCMPVGRDQPDTAARVVDCGAGLRLRPGASSRRISAALEQLLNDPRYRESAARMASAIGEDMKVDKAAEEIESLVG